MTSLSSSNSLETAVVLPHPEDVHNLPAEHDLTLKPTITKTNMQQGKLNRAVRVHRTRRMFKQAGSIVYNALAALAILLLYWVPGSIFAVVVVGLMLALVLGINAAYAAISMLIGNAILRAGHLAHYTDNAMAAAIGATGSPFAVMIMSLVSSIIPTQEDGQVPWFISIFFHTGMMTLSGTLGAAILRHNHVDLHGTDVLHATRAGALGGAILGPGSILAAPFVFLGLNILLSPLWIAMKLGLRWVYVRSNETWDDRGRYRSSHCYTYGTCGDDSDIEDELQQLPPHLRP